MAQYEVTGPDGSKYQVVAPDDASHDDIMRQIQAQGASVQKTSTPPNIGGGELDVSGGTQLRAAAQGIPIVGGFVSPTAESERFQQAFPKTSAADKVIAGGLATAPLFGASGGGLPGMAVGGALGAGDTAARGGDPGQIAMGGGLGALSSATGRATGGGVGNLITPHPATPEHQALVNTLQQEVPGVRLSAGQATGSQGLRIREQERGRGIDFNPEEPLQRDVTQNLMTRIGHGPTLATQPEMDTALQNIGATFDRVYGRNDLYMDPQLANDIVGIYNQYVQEQPVSMQRPLFGTIAQNAHDNVGSAMPGVRYGNIRSNLADMQRNATDHTDSFTAGRIKDAIDDAFERSIASNPTHPAALEDLGALRQARSDYRNYLTVEKAAGASNQQANYGYITPESLQSGVKQNEGVRNYATGRGDLSDLANAYAGVSRTIPNSMTAERQKANNVDRNIALIIGGAGTGEAYNKMQDQDKQGDFGYLEPVVGGLGGYALGKGISSAQGHMMFNPAMQAYLRNQIMTPRMQAILRALGAGAGTATVPQTAPAAQTIVNTLTGNKPNAP